MSIAEYLHDVPVPKMVRVSQRFAGDALENVDSAVRGELARPEIRGNIAKGMRIALAVGSRGMDLLVPIVAALAAELRALGAEPFIVPAMGSHGGATAEGQTALLAGLGVTEESAGCPILSSMETVKLGELPNGLPVLMDANAMGADGIVPLNRIKPHTGFSSEIESGVVKMLSIGLGKHLGAASCHSLGYEHMGRNIVEMARIKLEKTPVLFGVATVENAYDKVARIVALSPASMIEDEAKLLLEAKANMPRILFDPIDVLIVDRMGKEYSGTGMDPNITGRANTPYVRVSQKTGRMAVLDLSDKSKGNAAGMGLADVTTQRLFDKFNREATYINHLTSTVLSGGMLPLVMASDRLAVQSLLKTCNILDPAAIRTVRIRNTLHIDEIYISESLLPEAEQNPNVTIMGKAEDWPFDAAGNLTDVGVW